MHNKKKKKTSKNFNFYFSLVTSNEVEKDMNQLNISKSLSYNFISTKIIKDN